jgi:hypothetical protein
LLDVWIPASGGILRSVDLGAERAALGGELVDDCFSSAASV